MTDSQNHYHIRKTARIPWPYTLYYGDDYPWCQVEGVYMTLRGAKRGMERRRARRSRPPRRRAEPSVVFDEREA